jgi:5-methyltetrahydrofolate--homocysteine methyltransferase
VRHARDAMSGLALANEIVSGKASASVAAEETPEPKGVERPSGTEPPGAPEPAAVLDPAELPEPPDLERHVLDAIPVSELIGLVNPQMLYGKHLGVRGSVRRLLETGDSRLEELQMRIAALQEEALELGWISPAGIFGFFRAHGDDDEVVLLSPTGEAMARLPYPRQRRGPRRSAADWVHPDPEAGDACALMVVTAGGRAAEAAADLREVGRLLDSHALQALALELAEAAAEWLHRRIRSLWGFPDGPELGVPDVLKARYRGIRLSFGYPACPDLTPQRDLFRLLKPEEIGVTLTEGLMMSPEASVSAVAFHHPDARYIA